MIRESAPWKAELLRDADLIERWAKKTVASERRSALLERKVFVSAYAIRRLNEAVKISSRFREVTLPVTRLPPTGASIPTNGTLTVSGTPTTSTMVAMSKCQFSGSST